MDLIEHVRAELAPGDRPAAGFDWSGFDVGPIALSTDRRFDLVYDELNRHFGPKGQLEQREVILARMRWDPTERNGDYSLAYELMAVLKKGAFVAARDHSVIIRHAPHPEAIVHLSHVLVEPKFRGSGIAAWLRAWPIRTARAALAACGYPRDSPLTLVAEMEVFAEDSRQLSRQMNSYERAGFLLVEPEIFSYAQPDFRDVRLIDCFGRGAVPVPLSLVVRRVGREDETVMSGLELLRLVRGLYQMYNQTFREQDMAPLWRNLALSELAPQAPVRLLRAGRNNL